MRPALPARADLVPVPTDARLAGGASRARMLVDPSHRIDVTAFTLADPYRVITDKILGSRIDSGFDTTAIRREAIRRQYENGIARGRIGVREKRPRLSFRRHQSLT
jgi:hypothetical protein